MNAAPDRPSACHLLARLMHVPPYRMDEVALHGTLKIILARMTARRTEPHINLH